MGDIANLRDMDGREMKFVPNLKILTNRHPEGVRRNSGWRLCKFKDMAHNQKYSIIAVSETIYLVLLSLQITATFHKARVTIYVI